MSQQPSGWYQDPSDPDMLRFWDGISWTAHTTPRKSPTASQSTIGLPQQPPAAQGAPAPTTPMPQGSGWQSGPNEPLGGAPQVPQAPQQGGYQQGGYPQQGGYAPAPANAQWMHNIRTTADGVPLASWGKRLLAWILDGILIAIVGGVLARTLVPEYEAAIEKLMDAFTGSAAQSEVQAAINGLTGPAAKVTLLTFLVASVYAIAFWTTTGQTLGKMAARISVRRADRPGPLDLMTAVRRRLLGVLSVIPGLNGIYGIIALLDGLWPLWDDKRQTLHDKIAATQVVEGKQPRRQ